MKAMGKFILMAGLGIMLTACGNPPKEALADSTKAGESEESSPAGGQTGNIREQEGEKWRMILPLILTKKR